MKRILIPDVDAPPYRPAQAVVRTLGGRTMGTRWRVKLAAAPSAPLAALDAALQEIMDRVDGEMSPWIPDSVISAFNRAPAGSWVETPAAFSEVLSGGLSVAKASGGAFDPSIGALVDLWGFGPPGPRAEPPPDAEIEAALARAGWSRLATRAAGRQVRQPGGLKLDFSGVAKGYAVDEAARFLGRIGYRSFLVEVGGELRGQGAKPDGTPWWVRIERPPRAASFPDTLVALHELSIATSGDYRRSFEHAGRRYAHTIDPRTGRPLATPPASVAVLHQSCMIADAWATALTVLGAETGLVLAESRDLAALFVHEDGEERMSPALARLLD